MAASTATATAALLCVATLMAAAASAEHLPPEYPVCKRDSPDVNECIRKAVDAVIKLLPGGIPSLGVPPIDPLEAPMLEISNGTKNVNLKITFRNVHLTGLTRGILEDANLDLANNQLYLAGTQPNFDFEADYEMSGKFMVVPVEGKGRCKFTFTNLHAELTLISDRQKKGDNEYWKLKESPLSYPKLEHLELKFENLFNGDQTLGPEFNRLINENWAEFWEALHPAFEQSFQKVFYSFSANVFEKVPLEEVFPLT